ncbi:MAG: pyridoxamine 5'-phosphate oxidase family protein [Deltaproteobacteria bacterium]|nr:pyridoxamine 5'-phosphate oxidase family protein [Deltaproteobacteria bacterium]
MIAKMKKLIEAERFCVLATVSDNIPHCSLMAYAPEEDCSRLYMTTRRNTVKYGNMVKNPSVSLLIDTRGEKKSRDKDQRTQALTISGRFEEIVDKTESMKVGKMLILRHPDLGVFLEHPESCTFAIEIHSFLHLDGLIDSYYEEVRHWAKFRK